MRACIIVVGIELSYYNLASTFSLHSGSRNTSSNMIMPILDRGVTCVSIVAAILAASQPPLQTLTQDTGIPPLYLLKMHPFPRSQCRDVTAYSFLRNRLQSIGD
jgi:hypothetical protein